jgi:MFS family permease
LLLACLSLRSLRARFDESAGGLPAAFWLLWTALIVNRLGTFVAAFLATYLVRERGTSAAEAGRIVALFGLGMTVAGPLGGLLCDRAGRRATMVLALFSGALSVTALAFTSSLPLLALLSFLCGATGEAFRPALNAAIADLVPVADRSRAYGLSYWATNFALSVGWGLGSLIASRGITALFLTDAATSVLCGALILWRVPETRPAGLVHEPAVRGLLRTLGDGQFALFLVLHVAALVVFCQWQLGLPLDMAAHGFGPSAYAILMGFNCAGVVVLQPLVAHRIRGRDPGRLLALMALLFGLGYGVNALGGSLFIYCLSTSLWTVGEVIGFPTAATLVADLAPVDLRGRYQGAYSTAFGLAFMLSPLMGGELLGRFGSRTLWLACLALALVVSAGHLAAGRARAAAARGR